MIYEHITKCDNETEDVGRELACRLLDGGIRRAFIALRGEMGVGKTAFSRGFTSAICKAGVRSPTYTVVNEYRGGPLPVFHFDMYRIEDADDLYSIGFYDYLEGDAYCLCEWSENIEGEIPADAIYVTISRMAGDENTRSIKIEE